MPTAPELGKIGMIFTDPTVVFTCHESWPMTSGQHVWRPCFVNTSALDGGLWHMFLSGLLTTPFNTITTHHELFIQMPDKGYNSFHGRKYLAFIYFLSLGTILKIDWEMLHVVSAERKYRHNASCSTCLVLGPGPMALWSKKLPLTSSYPSPLPGFESYPGHVIKLSVTKG